VQVINSKQGSQGFLTQPVVNALDRLQSDNAMIADDCEVWLSIKYKLHFIISEEPVFTVVTT